MKYSEIKKIVTLLRSNGFEKFKGINEYFYQISKEDCHTRVRVMMWELERTKYPEIYLNKLKEHARDELETFYRSERVIKNEGADKR